MPSNVNEKRAIFSGRVELENGKWINTADRLVLGTTPFHESRVVSKDPQLVLNSDIPISERRDDITENNNATITQESGEYRMRATADTNSEAILRTRQRGNYLSGSVMDPGIGVRIPEQPTGDAFVRWGYYDTSDGIYFEYDATGVYVVLKTGGSESVRVEQANWNKDILDGNNGNDNPSGGTLDLSSGNIFQFPFVYYGYGGIQWETGVQTRFGDYEMVSVHEEKMIGAASIEEPNLPLSVEVNSGTSGAQLDCFVGGRQISPLGTNDNTARSVGADRLNVGSIGTSFVPLVSFKHKTSFVQVIIRLAGVTILPDSNDFIMEIHRNATLNGESFGTPGNHVAGEIASQWDTSATSTYTPGETMFEDLIAGGNKGALSSRELPPRPISELDTITLAVRTVSASNASVSAMLRISEDW